jgi:hypothetical protein
MKLLNVSEAYENPISADHLQYLETIESLSGCTQFMNFQKLSNLKSITFDSETSADSDINENSITTPLSSLKSISFCLPGDISPNLLTFIKHKRQNVSTLSIEFQLEEEPTGMQLSQLFPSSILTENYNKLQHLTLIDWNGLDDDLILIFQSLKSLVSLKLYNCLKITDRGFLGPDPDQPVLLNLKRM